METIVKKYMESLELGDPQEFQNMSVFPILTSENHSPEYLTLKEILDRGLLIITEVSHGGSVPELLAKNMASIPILLLDGEELVGAKQNRIVNTTILLKELSETVIPVSCTEQGRWSYASSEFGDSGVIMSQKIRTGKSRAVADNLRSSNTFRANQGEVWADISEMSMKAEVASPTGAMRDVFESQGATLEECLHAFTSVPGQKGLLVCVNGKIAGFDLVSLESAYTTLHPKLIKSYAIDALLQVKQGDKKVSIAKAKAFLAETADCKEERYKSIGHGWDYRYESPAKVGSALVSDGRVIHMAFFRASQSEQTSRMSGYRKRKSYRGI